jgi:hypothetical protein
MLGAELSSVREELVLFHLLKFKYLKSTGIFGDSDRNIFRH